MAYSELIKDFEKIRDYMRQFYVYGFKSRDEYDAKSARSYDNERRRMESWLGEYMSFRQDDNGKIAFMSVDSQEIISNPLYKAFKAKSFTSNDIALNFFILDILSDGRGRSTGEITDIIADEYLSEFEDYKLFDESTVRNKLKEYDRLGIIRSEKEGRKLLYFRSDDDIDLESWKEAFAFFSEVDLLGVIGSFLMDKLEDNPDYITQKHHYILHALESQILLQLLTAIDEDRMIELEIFNKWKQSIRHHMVMPIKILISTQNGRSYLYGRRGKTGRFNTYRIDNIRKVKLLKDAARIDRNREAADKHLKHVWNISIRNDNRLEHVELTLKVEEWANYIVHRLRREGKHGVIEYLGDGIFKFSIDVYDASEMLPWIRTFTGRILRFECSNTEVQERFYADLELMYREYRDKDGGDKDAI